VLALQEGKNAPFEVLPWWRKDKIGTVMMPDSKPQAGSWAGVFWLIVLGVPHTCDA
jgi:hypothetical protein